MNFRNEEQFTTAVIELAKMNRWRVIHMRGNTKRLIQGHAGYPDLTLAKGGDVEFWELKMPNGKLSDEQLAWGRALHPLWHCWYPADWDRIISILTSA